MMSKIRCLLVRARFIVIAAFLTTLGEAVDLSALLYGKVSLVVPIFALTPLVAVFLSQFFLKEHEIAAKRIVIAAILIIIRIYFTISNAL